MSPTSRERVRAALASIGLALPPKRIAINLAPADVVKEGAHYDLPIALGLLAAIGTVPADAVDGAFVLGELSLHGGIEPVSGAPRRDFPGSWRRPVSRRTRRIHKTGT